MALLHFAQRVGGLGEWKGSGHMRLHLSGRHQIGDFREFSAVGLDGVARGANAVLFGFVLRRVGQRRHKDSSTLEQLPRALTRLTVMRSKTMSRLEAWSSKGCVL